VNINTLHRPHKTAQEDNTMGRKCFLETDGYRVSFDLQDIQTSKENVDMIVEFILDQHLGGIMVKSVPTFIASSDLYRLATYFEEHIAQLPQNPDRASYTFVPMELGFQVQALAGEVHAENDGEFSVRFLVNVGKSKDEGERVYVGGESVVTLKNIRRFIASLHEALADLPRADGMRLS
jgi:hypothetical protein